MEGGKGEKVRERCIYVSLGREHALFIRVLREALPASKCLFLLPFLPPFLSLFFPPTLLLSPFFLYYSPLITLSHISLPLSLSHYWWKDFQNVQSSQQG